MKELTCTLCPRGCRLRVDEANGFSVTQNACPRGAEYGRAECENPVRTVTSTIRMTSGPHPRCPVRTDRPIPKEKITDTIRIIKTLTLRAPFRIGQVVLKDICGTGANIIATRSL